MSCSTRCAVCARSPTGPVRHARSKNKTSRRDDNRTRGRKANSDRRRYLFCSVRCPDDAQWRTIWRGRTPCTHACTQVTHTWVMLKGNRLWGTVKHQHGIPIPASVAALTKRQERPPPDPSHHPNPSHTNSNRDSTNKVRRCTRQNSLLKSNRPEDLCFCRRRCSHCGGGARGGHRRRTRPSLGLCWCRRRLGR